MRYPVFLLLRPSNQFPVLLSKFGNGSNRLLFSDHAHRLERLQFRGGVPQQVSVNFPVVFANARRRLVKADSRV